MFCHFGKGTREWKKKMRGENRRREFERKERERERE